MRISWTCLLATTLPTVAAAGPVLEPDVPGGYASDQVMIRLEPALAELVADLPPAEAARALGAHAVRSLALEPAYPLRFADPGAAAALGLDRWFLLRFPPGTDTPALAGRLAADTDGVEAAEPAWIGTVADPEPNDEHFGLCWGLRNVGQPVPGGVSPKVGNDVRAIDAWSAPGGQAPVIAVIDSGVNPHPELAGRLLPGWNFVSGNSDTTDLCNHGTHVAGIIAAEGNNSIGIPGLAWDAQILPVRVLLMCSGTETDAANGVIYAADQGARIASMSLQYFAGSQYFRDAIAYADQAGTLLIAASGNNNSQTLAFPARWPEVLSVGAVDASEARASFSNYGPDLDISAPGVDIYSLDSKGGYRYGSGTSMAAPFATGAAALLWALNPALSPQQVRDTLKATARDTGQPGPDSTYGAGIVDAGAALAATPCYADFNADGTLDVFDFLAFQSAFVAGDPAADCDRVTRSVSLDLYDFLCFLSRFTSGC